MSVLASMVPGEPACCMRMLAHQAVLAQAAQALVEVAGELFVADNQDDLAGGVGVGA